MFSNRIALGFSLVLVLIFGSASHGQPPQTKKENTFTGLTTSAKNKTAKSVAYTATFSVEGKGAARTAALATIKALSPPGAKVTITEPKDGNTIKENELGLFLEYQDAPDADEPFLKAISSSGNSITVTYHAAIKPAKWKSVAKKVGGFVTGKQKGKWDFAGIAPKKSIDKMAFKVTAAKK